MYFTESKITSDFIVDALEDFWSRESSRFSHIQTIVINQDNGPENNSHRTQFMKRMVNFAHQYKLKIRLAYYPPYHSKYNPIERTWAVLENHWNGSILSEIETALKFAETMTWKSKHPWVKLVTQTYENGVKLSKKEMAKIENKIQRLTNLESSKFSDLGKWFVDLDGRTI